MTIEEFARANGIEEILHFTTNLGVLGMLDGRYLKARARLNEDARLEYIFRPNAVRRDKDADWLDYANLSISRINRQFFAASDNWHRNENIWWCVLSFSPAILSHEGVVFTTTNNIYTGVRRDAGVVGLANMFAPAVTRWVGNVVTRTVDTPSNFSTCEQAEVLYPAQLSTEYLQRIYVTSEQSADELAAQIHVLRHPLVPIEIKPEIFN